MQVIYGQLKLIQVQWVNVLFNILLGDDYLRGKLRTLLLPSLGNRIGPGTRIRGGSNFAGGGLSTTENCFINRDVYMNFTESIKLGKNVTVGYGVSSITAHHELGSKNARAGVVAGNLISISDGVWIGANSTILPGITIGSGSVVAAGCVVTQNILEHSLVAGIPGQIVRSFDEADLSNTLESLSLQNSNSEIQQVIACRNQTQSST